MKFVLGMFFFLRKVCLPRITGNRKPRDESNISLIKFHFFIQKVDLSFHSIFYWYAGKAPIERLLFLKFPLKEFVRRKPKRSNDRSGASLK